MNIALKCLYCVLNFKQAFNSVDRKKKHTDITGTEDTK